MVLVLNHDHTEDGMSVALHHTRRSSTPQPSRISPDLWSREIIPRLPPDLEAQARTLHALQRHRAFACAGDLLRALLAYVLAPYSFAALGAWAVMQDLADICPTAWRKRLGQANPWLGWLLSVLLAHRPTTVPLARGHRVRLIDATRLRQWRGTGDDWRVHLSYDVSIGQMDQVVVTTRHGAEGFQHAGLRPGDLCVADAGFGIRASVAMLHAQAADGILRVYPPNFPVEDALGQRIDLTPWLATPGGPVIRDLACWCRYGQQRFPVRLLALPLPAEVAAAKRRRKLKEARDKSRTISETKLFYLGMVVLVTTLDHAWPAEDIFQMYRARWQIELVFKRIKQLLRTHVIRSTTPAQAEATVRLHLIAWALQEQEAVFIRGCLRTVHHHLCVERPGTKELGTVLGGATVSSWVLANVCLATLRSHVVGQWPWERLRACLPRLHRFLCPSPRQRPHQETVIRTWLLHHGFSDPRAIADTTGGNT